MLSLLQSKLDNGVVESRMINIQRDNPAKRAISAMARMDSKNHLCGKFRSPASTEAKTLEQWFANMRYTHVYNNYVYMLSHATYLGIYFISFSPAGLIYKSQSGTDLVAFGQGLGGIH